MSHRTNRAACLTFGLALLLLAGGARAQDAAVPSGLTPLSQILDQDGSLAVPNGFTGSLDARGYRMVVTEDGSPRFVQAAPAAAADGDENWSDLFGIAGLPYGRIYTMARDGNDLYVGGWFQKASNLPADNVARWDGRAWSTLGKGIPDGTVYALAVYNGDLYVGGSFTQAGDIFSNGIARWDGTTWHPVGEGGVTGQYSTHAVYALAVFDGALYAAGDFIQAGGVDAVGVARWDGSTWSPLGSGLTGEYEGLNGTGYALAASSTALYVGGDFDLAGGAESNSLAAWNGTSWSTVGDGVQLDEIAGTVKALAVDGQKLYVGGRFDKAGTVNARSIAVYDRGSQSWSALGIGVRSGTYDGEVLAVLPSGNDVYVAGNFDVAGSVAASYVAKWNGSAWAALVHNGLQGLNYSPATSLAPGPNGSVYVGGEFYKTGPEAEMPGALALNAIGQWDGSKWQVLGQGVHTGNSAWNVYSVAVSQDGKVYVGGAFHYAGDVVAENIAMWDGTDWHPLGSGVDHFVEAIVTRGDDVFVGGSFTQAGGQAAARIAKWNAATKTWSPLGSGINGPVLDLAVDQQYLYAVGNFTGAGTAPAVDMARWDGTSWSMFGQGMVFNQNAEIRSIALDGDMVYLGGDIADIKPNGPVVTVNGLLAWRKNTNDWFLVGGGVTKRAISSDVWGIVNDLVVTGGQLYVGGSFDKAGGQVVANGIARFDLATGQWSALGSSIGGDYTQEVRGLVLNGQDLFAAGRFESAGGVNSSRIARWNIPAQTWHALGSGILTPDGGSWVNDLATFGDKVYAVGYFETAGGKASSSFAQWTTTGGGEPVGGAVAQIGRTSVNFGEARVGEGLEHTFTIANAPEADAALVGSVGAAQAPFDVTTGSGSFNLAPGQSHLVTVRFRPQAEGSFSGSLVISHNAANVASPVAVSLSGTGMPSTASVVLRGFDPQADEQRLYEVLQNQEFAGYIFGTNKYADRAKGTALKLPSGAAQGSVTEIKVWFAHKKTGLTNQNYTLKLYDGTAENGPAGEPLYVSQSYRLADIAVSAATVHTLPQPVRVGNSFFVVVDFGQYAEGDFDMAALSSTEMGNERVAEVWEQWSDGSWANASDVYFGGGEPGAGNRGWKLWIEATANLGTSTPNEQETPGGAEFTLGQNAPNPTGAATSIRFTLPATGHATLKVYDALGREVATLVDGPLPAGPHAATLDASDLTSGIYFYTLRTSGESRTRKMVVVR